MKVSRAFWSGVTGAVMITIVTIVARAVGVPINLEMLLGSMFTGIANSSTWLLGLLIHMLLGGAFGLVYGLGFERVTHRSDWPVGLAFGTVHAVIAGLLLGLLPMIHPAIPGVIDAPGPFASALGGAGFVLFILAHMAFGALVAGMYAPVVHADPVIGTATVTR